MSTRNTKVPERYVGRWRITESELWSAESLDLVKPAHITFEGGRHGGFAMIAIVGQLDCRYDGDAVEFTWEGTDDGDARCGRGWAELGQDGLLRGRLFIHLGDVSEFVARRDAETPQKQIAQPQKGRSRRG